MIFDATKVTYNKFSCAISGMSRKMMKMDNRDSTECQNWEKKGHKSHFLNCLNDIRDKTLNSVVSYKN